MLWDFSKKISTIVGPHKNSRVFLQHYFLNSEDKIAQLRSDRASIENVCYETFPKKISTTVGPHPYVLMPIRTVESSCSTSSSTTKTKSFNSDWIGLPSKVNLWLSPLYVVAFRSRQHPRVCFMLSDWHDTDDLCSENPKNVLLHLASIWHKKHSCQS